MSRHRWIFVVDHDGPRAATVASALTRSFYEADVTIFYDAGQAIAAARGRRPSLIVSAHEMPSMDGRDLIGRIRQEAGHAPAIVVGDDTRVGEIGPGIVGVGTTALPGVIDEAQRFLRGVPGPIIR